MYKSIIKMKAMTIPILIIGANSKIVGAIVPLLKCKFELASHKDIEHINWSQFRYVIVFSWPKRDYDKFLQKISAIPASKLVFISTTAVLALQMRPQWSAYPVQKYRFEQHVLKRKGRVVRIGVTLDRHATQLIGSYPFTSMTNLASVIDSLEAYSEPIINAFEIRLGRAEGWCHYTSIALHRLSLALPSVFFLQIMVQGLAKFLNLKHYGYTADANFYFKDTIQIGYGALGRFGPKLKAHKDLIITSPNEDVILNENGFSKTRLGYDTIGLARFWHGVELVPGSSRGFWRKYVPLFIDRSRPKNKIHHSLHIDRVFEPDESGSWAVVGHNNRSIKISFWCKTVIMASGPINNTRLLQSIVPARACFSDHEIGMVGIVSLKNAVSAGFVRRSSCFMHPDQVRSMTTNCGLRFVVEARPHVPLKHLVANQDASSFYLDSMSKIIYKILTNLDFNRINEAIFNKFGIGLITKNCSIFVQALVANSIVLEGPQSADSAIQIHRKRLTRNQWKAIQETIIRNLTGFIPDRGVIPVDAQHIVGAASLLASTRLTELLGDGKLKIFGSPTLCELDECHHTSRWQREIRAQSQPLLLYLPVKIQGSGGHDEIVAAISEYARPWPVCISGSLGSGLFQLKDCRAVFFQKTTLSNIPMALVAACLRIPRILYLHEPLSILQRRRKGVPWPKACFVTLFQVVEVFFMTRLLTGNPANSRFCGRPLNYAPLVFPAVKTSVLDWNLRNGNVLYFGRIDNEKYFDEFQKLPFKKTVVATSNLNVRDYAGPVGSVSYEEKKEFFQSHRFVWCVQKNSLTQSAVVIDAVKFGCCCLLREGDPIRERLPRSAYVEIPSDFDFRNVVSVLDAYTDIYPSGPEVSDTFSFLCGQHAFDEHWRDLLV
jgi:hypothetical protein